KVADAYIDHSVIVQNALDDPYVVDSVFVDEAKLVKYSYALHEGYSGMNDLEKAFATALDKTKKSWCRNPSQGGYEIPLLDRGSTRTFNPDFLRSGLIDQSQKMTVAAMQIADMKVWAHR